MMREVFEAFLTDPVRVNEDVFALWLEGRHANDALAVRLRSPHESLSIIGDDHKMRELLWRDTVDQYRLYEKLEHYLMQPSLFRSQLLFQIPPIQQYFMIERYYSLDGHVARWLVGKKLTTAKIQKDLDEISEQSQRTLKSCRRQLENLRRVYSAMEERNFQGVCCKAVGEIFSLSEKLASKYSCVLFLLHARLEVHPTHRTTSFLTWHDLLFIAAVIMVHWVPQRKTAPVLLRTESAPAPMTTTSDTLSTPLPSPGFGALSPPPVVIPQVSLGTFDNPAEVCFRSNDKNQVWPKLSVLQERLVPTSVRGSVGLDLSTTLTNGLRDLKAHLINDSETLAIYRENVMTHLKELYDGNEMKQLSVKLYLVVHGLLTIGAGLSQPKELKDLLGNLVSMVIRVLHDCGIQRTQLDDVFTALIDSLPKLDVWYLHGLETRSALLASWERFLSVTRVLVLLMFDRGSLSSQ
ncbi:hypothetical protein Poli38472_001046 [Pythium oligandrum]|uniref:Acidic fibroblast growth factor intracellular-binding protein n=1 Tax=Pythium oligandrum TaxID=41045 RepID=A0A8K1CSR1_PYTOL|nr:hypothetical protein Poli38472_001046 [Pythium oligandrum]|eukprot:TMW68890.1 hypothetical protein Poli38472_001046 [Pythium oligandrum]